MSDESSTSRSAWILTTLETFEGPLVGYAARITGSVESAKDVVQEVFLRLCRETPAELNGRIGPWLYAVCRNKALDVRRKDKRMKVATVEPPACESAEQDPAEAVETREGSGRALRLLATLPDKQQEVIRLRFQESLSYRQIAEVTGLSIGNVGFLIHTAIKTLRESLAEDQ